MTSFKPERLSDLVREHAGLSVKPGDLHFLKGSGLNHDHVVLGNSGWLARVPRGNTWMTADEYLSQQETVYSAAAASRHTPPLLTVIRPEDGLAYGALIVKRVPYQRTADFAIDYPAIAAALAAIHRTAPPPALSAPAMLGDSQRGFIDMFLAPALESPRLNSGSKALLTGALDQARDDLSHMAKVAALPVGFIASDTHAGNFLIDRSGKAWMPDLEYATVDCPLIDISMPVCPVARQFDPLANPVWPVGTSQKFFSAWLNEFSGDRANDQRRALIDARPAMTRVVLTGSLGWLAFWDAQGRQTMRDVPDATARNWDRMVAENLEPQALNATLRQNGFGAGSALRRLASTVGSKAAEPAF